jgi:plastocyanin
MHAHSPRLLLAIALFASGSVAAATHSVVVGGSSGGYYGGNAVLMFSPSNLTIDAGDSVVFTNAGGAHNVHADDESFRCARGCDGGTSAGNGDPSPDEWHATVTFDHPGSVSYHCDNHAGMGMTGTITVQSMAADVQITSGFTGTWGDAGATGQLGLNLEVLTGGNLVAEAYMFAPAGGQAWVGGIGPIDGDHATIGVSTINGAGGRFAPNFDPTQVQNTRWGTLTLRFSDCNHGTLDWASSVPGYASGSLPIIRVTQPAGLSCP